MAIVIVLDQQRSSKGPDLVEVTSSELNDCFGAQLRLPFVRTAGDEMQAVLGDPAALAPIAAHVVESGMWWVGLGLGDLIRIGHSARESAGPAFRAAREAIDAAKHARRSPGPMAVRGEPEPLVRSLEAALGAFAFIIQSRTDRQREVVGAVRNAPSHQAAATALRVSRQTVSKTLASSGYAQETQLAELITKLAAEAIDAG